MRLVDAIRRALKGIWLAQKTSLVDPLRKIRIHYEDALMFVTLGELLGYPFQSTYYSRLLLAYWLPKIPSWRRRLLKEYDVLDRMSD